MSRKDKLLKRFLNMPKDFTYDELVRLLAAYNFKEENTGKTSGSAVKFVNDEFPAELIRFHKPHPTNIIKKYVLVIIRDCLIRCELIELDDEEAEEEQ